MRQLFCITWLIPTIPSLQEMIPWKRRRVQNLDGISHIYIYVMICIYGIIIIDQLCNIGQNLGRSWVIILSFGKAWMLWTLHMFNHRSSFPLLFSPGKRGIPICAVSLFLSFPIQNGGLHSHPLFSCYERSPHFLKKMRISDRSVFDGRGMTRSSSPMGWAHGWFEIYEIYENPQLFASKPIIPIAAINISWFINPIVTAMWGPIILPVGSQLACLWFVVDITIVRWEFKS